MKIIICGGGTAGHVTPGIAIAEYIKKHSKDSEILFIGREGGEENELIKEAGFRLITLEVQGFKRRISLKNFTALTKALTALRKAHSVLTEFMPDVVLGTGGYVTWPVIKAAQRLNIPTAIHESNAYPGLTTRMLSASCAKVFLNLEECKSHLKRQDNTIKVGNPLREGFKGLTKEEARKKLRISPSEVFILSFGGSGGADLMNKSILPLMEKYARRDRRVRHLHATGRKYFDGIEKEFPALTSEHTRCRAVPFINDMPTYMLASDIVISRAGAMTLSEISEASSCPIIIPSPNVTDNHQYKNAKAYEAAGGGIVIEEDELTTSRLKEEIERLISDRKRREEIAKCAHCIAIPNSAKIIVEELKKIATKASRAANKNQKNASSGNIIKN